ncbi:putative iron reductase [Moniliophthora roreri]|uniref:FAD-binding FR-type domain-containing protein n=1 Tax=Moniliophthora roreri TaxID=221103 RepID=A0A0W0G2W9_MONRR|nr:putative iron reductase [Moniliophthora roreri]
MSDFGTPPVIPQEFQQYNSYEIDPQWQRKFSIIWASVLAGAVFFSIPHLARSIRSNRAFTGIFGVRERYPGMEYIPIVDEKRESLNVAPATAATTKRSRTIQRLEGVLSMVGSVLLWSAPGLGVNLGQIILLVAYAVTLVICIVKDAVLVENANRAGFMAIAQLPIVFLFATKNSIVSLLLGPGNGYERLNFIHRWSGRGMFLGAVLHGSLWINNHLVWNIQIIGSQKETSGVAALALLCIIVLTTARPMRMYFYQVFFWIHVLAFVAFFITVCYHTIYAPPWIFPPLAFYGFDMLLRLFKYRIKDATLTPVNKDMTLIRIPHCDAGWEAGQHVRLRVFFSGRVFESHPLSIMNASTPTSCLTGSNRGGIILGARVRGDWTRALNVYATSERAAILSASSTKTDSDDEIIINPDVPIQVMIDGPYGGSSVDLGRYESVLLIAGGSGATFTLGLLDDIVGRCVRLERSRGERTRRIEFAWCVKSFGCIEWFAPMLADIARTVEGVEGLDLHISVYVTCLCNPDAVPMIPNMDVSVYRPSVKESLKQLITPPSSSSSSTLEEVMGKVIDPESGVPPSISTKLPWIPLGGGVAVCAAGPEGLTREASNAVASVSLTRGVELGSVGLHTEVYSM